MDLPLVRPSPPSLLAAARQRGDVMACDCPSRLVLNHRTAGITLPPRPEPLRLSAANDNAPLSILIEDTVREVRAMGRFGLLPASPWLAGRQRPSRISRPSRPKPSKTSRPPISVARRR